MSFSLAGLGWPSSQNNCSSSLPIGNAPHVCETAVTPVADPSFSSNSRKAARILSGGAFIIDGGIDTFNVRTPCGLNPGSTLQSRVKLLTTNPAQINSTSAPAISVTTDVLTAP